MGILDVVTRPRSVSRRKTTDFHVLCDTATCVTLNLLNRTHQNHEAMHCSFLGCIYFIRWIIKDKLSLQ